MIWNTIELLLSLFFLLLSADYLVAAVVRIAESMKVSTMVVGLTVVALGTSLPEVMSSVAASFRGFSDIAVNNVVGSNICNIGLILGVPALLAPVTCSQIVVKGEGLQMLFVSLLFWFVAITLSPFNRLIGILSVALFIFYVYLAFRNSASVMVHEEVIHDENDGDAAVFESVEDVSEEFVDVAKEALHISSESAPNKLSEAIKIVCFLFVLLFSSEFLVRSTVALARGFEVSEGVIALSLLALGTSLPELSVSIAAIRRGEGEIVVGNIVGSNISNILLVLGLSVVVRPFGVEGSTLRLDIPVMIIFAILMVLFLLQKSGVTRSKGIILLIGYCLVIWRCVHMPL